MRVPSFYRKIGDRLEVWNTEKGELKHQLPIQFGFGNAGSDRLTRSGGLGFIQTYDNGLVRDNGRFCPRLAPEGDSTK